MEEGRDTQELRAEQLAREVEELRRAQSAGQDTEEAAHDRRADKARYLRERLDERAESERQAAEQERSERE